MRDGKNHDLLKENLFILSVFGNQDDGFTKNNYVILTF